MTDEAFGENDTTLAWYAAARAVFVETLEEVVALACSGVTHCSEAGLTVIEAGSANIHVATDECSTELDTLQYVCHEGPGFEAIRTGSAVSLVSVGDETRWPAFCEAARRGGVTAALAFPLLVDDLAVGAMSLFSEDEDGFDQRDEETGAAIAAHASVTLASSRDLWRNEGVRRNLEEALTTRGVIDQAKGILIARQGCGPAEAFEMLRRASQRSNRKVHDIARELVESAQHGSVPNGHP